MLPRRVIAEALTPAGDRMTLVQEGVALVVRVRGEVLMSSRVHGSEEVMAEVGCKGFASRSGMRVLVGGLGLGYTARAALDCLAADGQLVIREIMGAIVEWNRGPLRDLAGAPLEDPRTVVEVGDVRANLGKARFDAILLDVDNGPEALTVPGNARLYDDAGLAALRQALRPGGALVVWSAGQSPRFERSLRKAGLVPEVVRVRARGHIARGSSHVLYVGRNPSGPSPSGARRAARS
jgi:spermidine synthase